MDDNIFEILHNYVPGQKEQLRQSIQHVKEQINTVHTQYGTPITYYCTLNLASDISLDVIKVLIEEFGANINPTTDNSIIPLSVFFANDNDILFYVKQLSIIEYLLYNTSISLLINTHNDALKTLLVRILTSTVLKEKSNVLDYIISTINTINDVSYHSLAAFYMAIEDAILNQQWIQDAQVSLQFLLNLNAKLVTLGAPYLNKRVLFIKALQQYNIKFAEIIEQSDPFVLNQLHFTSILDVDAVSDYTQHAGHFIASQLEGSSNTLVFGYMIYIPDLAHVDDLTGVLKRDTQMLNQAVQHNIKQWLSKYLQSGSNKKILKLFGYNNNIFHLLALCPQCFQIPEIINQINNLPDSISLFRKQNTLGHTPAKIALLRHNLPFIEHYKDLLTKYYKADTSIDSHNNKIGHIIIDAQYTRQRLNEILQILNIEPNSILSTTNTSGVTPLYYAIQNYDFDTLTWWIAQGGKLDIKDHNGRTLWHYFCQHSHAIATGLSNNRPNMWESLLRIYHILSTNISELVDIADYSGVKPIHLALLKPGIMKLLLDSFDKNINWTYQDANGNTIQHLLAIELVSIIKSNLIDNYLAVLELLIPYRELFKINYNVKNKFDQRPIDIISDALPGHVPLAVWLHQAISQNIIRSIARSEGHGRDSGSGDTNKSIRLFNLDYYDNIIFCSEHIIEQAKQVETSELNNTIVYIIKATALEITYTDINDWGDKVLHYLTNHTLLRLSTEISIIHVLRTIKLFKPELMHEIMYNMYNILGEGIIHSAIRNGYVDLVSTLIEFDIEIINHPISYPITDNIKKSKQNPVFIKYPADYATLYKKQDIIDHFISSVRQYNQRHSTHSMIIQCHWPQKPEYIHDFSMRDPRVLDINIDDARHEYDTQYQAKHPSLIEENRYFPLLIPHTTLLLYEGKNILLFTYYSTRVINNLTQLRQYCQGGVMDNNRAAAILFCYKGHASAIVLFKDLKGELHALLQDSQEYAVRDYAGSSQRLHTILSILKQELSIKHTNSHNFQVPQQCRSETNCVLWSLANIQTILKTLIRKRPSAWYKLRLDSNKEVQPYITSELLTKIQAALSTKSKIIVDQLQAIINRIHQDKNKDTIIAFIEEEINKFVARDTGAPESTQHITQDVLSPKDPSQDITYMNAPITPSTLAIILSTMENQITLAVQNIDDEYVISQYRVAIIIHPNILTILNHELSTFRDHVMAMQYSKASHTFVICENEHDWSTMLIVYTGEYTAYFMHTREQMSPSENIMSILKQNKIKHIAHIPFNGPTTYEYNYGLLAVQYALDLNLIIQKFTNYENLGLTSAGLYPTLIRLLSIENEQPIEPEDLYTAIRNKFRTQIESDISSSTLHKRLGQEVQITSKLYQQKQKIGLVIYDTDCTLDSSQHHKTKRQALLCNQDEEYKYVVHDPLEEIVPIKTKISTQWYLSIAYLISCGVKVRAQQLHLFINYVRNLGRIINQDPIEISKREQTILNMHHRNALSFATQYDKEKLLIKHTELNSVLDQHVPLLLENGSAFMIMSYEKEKYQFYSLSYNHKFIYETRTINIQFDDIKQFLDLFFMSTGHQNVQYQIWTFNDDMYAQILDQLKKLDVWRPENVLADIQLLENHKISNIPATAIRKLFFVNNKVPELAFLNDDAALANNVHSQYGTLSVRIDTLHIVFSSLEPQQMELLIKLIRQVRINVDNTYVTRVSSQDNDMVNAYVRKVLSKLKSADPLNLEDLSIISYEVLEHMISRDQYLAPLRNEMLNGFEVMRQRLVKHLNTADKIAQTLFFIPDIVKAYNTQEYQPLVKMGSLMAGDMSANYMIGKLANVLPNTRISLLRRYAASPICKVLTAYSIYELSKELSVTSTDAPEYIILRHGLIEQSVVVLVMLSEIVLPSLSPMLWLGLFIEQLLYTGTEINVLYNLNLPIFERIIMGLGFEEEQKNIYIEESILLKINLQGLGYIRSEYPGIYIVRIPPIKSIEWQDISDDMIPQNTKNVHPTNSDCLTECPDLKTYNTNISCVNTLPSQCEFTLDNLKVTKYFNCTKDIFHYWPFFLECSVYHTITYAQPQYHVSVSNDSTNTLAYDIIDIHNVLWYNDLYDMLKSLFWAEETSDVLFPKNIIYNNTNWNRMIDHDLVDSNPHYCSMYYDTNMIPFNSLRLYFHFDAREGNQYISFSDQWLSLMTQRYTHNGTPPVFTVYIGYKSYPSSVSWDSSTAHTESTFSFNASNTITSRYIVGDNEAYNNIADNSHDMRVICSKTRTFFVDSTESNLLIGTTNITMNNKRSIDLILNTCLIDKAVKLNIKVVNIENVLGHTNVSKILLGNKNQYFNITVRGTIILDHHDALVKVSGEYQQKHNDTSHNLQYSGNNSGNCTFIINNILNILSTFKMSINERGSSVSFTDDIVDVYWNSKDYTVKLYLSDLQQHNNSWIKIHNNLGILHIDRGQHMLEVSWHLNTKIHTQMGLELINVYHNNSDISHAQLNTTRIYAFDIIEALVLQNIKYHSFNNTMIVILQDVHNNKYYHIISNSDAHDNVNINNIDYKIANGTICTNYAPQYFRHSTVLDMLYLNYQKQKIGLCKANPVFENNLAYYHIVSLIMNSHLINIERAIFLYDTIIESKHPEILLRGHHFTSSTAISLMAIITLTKCPIEKIDLSYNDLSAFEFNDRDQLLNIILNIPSLKSLNLSHTQIDLHTLHMLISEIHRLKNLTMLNISYNNLSLKQLNINVIHNTCIKLNHTILIKISGNRPLVGLDDVADILNNHDNCSKIELVNHVGDDDDLWDPDMYHNWLTITSEEQVLNGSLYFSILDIVFNSRVRDINKIYTLGYILDDDGNQSNELLLSGQGLKPQALQSLVNVIENNKNMILSKIDLSYNGLSKNISILTPILPKINGLRVLNVSGNSLEDDTAVDIVFKLSTSGVTVDLSNNNITNHALFRILSDCTEDTNITMIVSDNYHIGAQNQTYRLDTSNIMRLHILPQDCDKLHIIDYTAGNQRITRHISNSDPVERYVEHEFNNENTLSNHNDASHLIYDNNHISNSGASTTEHILYHIIHCVYNIWHTCKNWYATKEIESDASLSIDNHMIQENMINRDITEYPYDFNNNITYDDTDSVVYNMRLETEYYSNSNPEHEQHNDLVFNFNGAKLNQSLLLYEWAIRTFTGIKKKPITVKLINDWDDMYHDNATYEYALTKMYHAHELKVLGVSTPVEK